MTTEKTILDSAEINRILTRMAHEILERHKDLNKVALIGIQTRGVYLARRLQEEIRNIESVTLQTGELDINLYRDDWTRISHQPIVKQTEIPFDVDDMQIILVDDVLFTGRTIRAAIDALLDFGRPGWIKLAVLADRGHREFPIQPDFTGKLIETSYDETINVHLKEHDGVDKVVIQRG